MPQTNKSAKVEIGVLYGFRALMILFVMNYHLWQQSWLPQAVRVGGRYIIFDFWTRSSYLFVDGMILMSAFLLYLPYAREKLEGIHAPSVKRFYFNRAVRILPSYLFAVFGALLLIAVPQGRHPSAPAMLKDVFAHLTFTFMFSRPTYLMTPLNMALWTIAVEVQFYLIFPLLVRAMKKHTGLTAGIMMLSAWLYRFAVSRLAQEPAMFINQMPAFLGVYAIGMLLAAGGVRFSRWLRTFSRWENTVVQVMSVLVFAAAAWMLGVILKVQSLSGTAGSRAMNLSQMAVRLPLAITFALLMFSASFWPRILQKLLDNRLMRFLSTISMNLYIWHQVLAVQMRLAWFPDTALLHSDRNLQAAYMLLCVSVAVLAAMAITFGLEQPLARKANRYIQIKD